MTTVRAAERAGLPPAVPLRRRYDVARLGAELAALADGRWRAQRAYGQGGVAAATEIDWRILSLRSIGGDPTRTDPGGAGLDAFADTPFLRRCPYFAEVLQGIPAPLRAVRLMSLGPGVRVHEHRDGKCGFPWGALRLHIPIVTNPEALVVIGGQTYHWDAGQLWFGDFDQLHHVRNTGPEPRIHLVVDTMVTTALLALFPADYLDQLPWPDVLLAHEEVPLRRRDLDTLTCQLSMPADFLEWSEEDTDPDAGDVPASVVADGGRLVLAVRDEPRFALVHIGASQFRFQGWTEERTMHIDLSAPTPSVRFQVRTGRAVTERTRPAQPWQGSTP